MNYTSNAEPKDAAAVILIEEKSEKVLWAKRNPALRFLGGFHGFPGGKVDETDGKTEVRNCPDASLKKFIACAARETFEESGVLLARNGDKLTNGQRASLHDDLNSGRNTFAEILDFWDLWIDAEDFLYAGFWTTPEFSPLRFKTRFFIARCPGKQKPFAASGEMGEFEFVRAEKACELWADSKVLIAPPVLISMRELAAENIRFAAESLRQKSSASAGNIDYIELNSRITCFPVRTETLPPATHTNCFIVGGKEFIVIDAAAKAEAEREKLWEFIEELVEKDFLCREIIVSHQHPDHLGAETFLKRRLCSKYGLDVPVAAHKQTAEQIKNVVKIDRIIADEETYKLKDSGGKTFDLTAFHAPGHTSGLLNFYDEEFGFLLSTDNVVGFGTVVIVPPDGNMSEYLETLRKLKNLPNLNFLCGSHGAATADAEGKIGEYIRHRLEREEQVLQCVRDGIRKPLEIAGEIYGNLNPNLLPLAEKTIEAHLEKLQREGRISFSA